MMRSLKVRFYLQVVKLTDFAIKCKENPKWVTNTRNAKAVLFHNPCVCTKLTVPNRMKKKKKKEEISECCKHLNSLSVTFTKSTSKSWGNQIQGFFFFFFKNNIWKYKRRDTRVKSKLDECQPFSRIKLISQETSIFIYSSSP